MRAEGNAFARFSKDQTFHPTMSEAYKFFGDWVRQQGGNVVLLSVAIVFLHTTNSAQVAELKATISQQNIRIDQQIEEIRKCDMERARLEARVEGLIVQLSQKFPNLK